MKLLPEPEGPMMSIDSWALIQRFCAVRGADLCAGPAGSRSRCFRWRRTLFELGDLQARGEFAIFPIQPLVIDEQAEELGLAEVW